MAPTPVIFSLEEFRLASDVRDYVPQEQGSEQLIEDSDETSSDGDVEMEEASLIEVEGTNSQCSGSNSSEVGPEEPGLDPKNESVSPTQAGRASSIEDRVRRNVEKTGKVEVRQTELPNIGVVNCKEILHYVLEGAEKLEHLKDRMQELGRKEIQTYLEKGLDSQVQRICENGLFEYEKILEIQNNGHDPATSDKAGIYLHVLSSATSPNVFWLYIGQSICLMVRVEAHNKKRRSSNHFCLHYCIWNAVEETQGVNSTFMTVFSLEEDVRNKLNAEQLQLVLNLAEMWLCCIFQTLTPVHLDKYLPPADRPWAGRHLNVALPLYQSFPSEAKETQKNKIVDHTESALNGRAGFVELIHSEDPLIKEWATSLRDAFNSLRHSQDPGLCGYWWKHNIESRNKAHMGSTRSSVRRNQRFLKGKQCRVHVEADIKGVVKTYISHSHVSFFMKTATRDLEFKDGDTATLKFHLSDKQHPHKHARNARPDDPASRLAVSVSGCCRGKEFFRMLYTDRDENSTGIKRLNSLVDVLDGQDWGERLLLAAPRRWFGLSIGEIYT